MSAPRVRAVIAAAGTSSRFVHAAVPAKLALAFDSTCSFAERLVDVFVAAGIADIVVTVPEMDSAAEEQLAPLYARLATRAALLPNRHPDLSYSGSLLTALEAPGSVDVLVATPVDCPFAAPDLVAELVAAAATSRAAAVPLVADGGNVVRGHPVAFHRDSFGLLATHSQRGGPRAALHALGARVAEVVWPDARVAFDVDDVDAYKRLFPHNRL